MHVTKYSSWVLGVVVVAWSITAAVGTWLAQGIGNVYSATAMGLLLVAGLAINVSMLPYPLWFKVVIMITVPIATMSGSRLALKRPTPQTSDTGGQLT